MNRAIRLPQYSDMKGFLPPPDGIQLVPIDRVSNLPADSSCPSSTFEGAFLTGTVPQSTCSHMGVDAQTLGSQLYGGAAPEDEIPPPAPVVPPAIARPAGPRLPQSPR